MHVQHPAEEGKPCHNPEPPNHESGSRGSESVSENQQGTASVCEKVASSTPHPDPLPFERGEGEEKLQASNSKLQEPLEGSWVWRSAGLGYAGFELAAGGRELGRQGGR